MPLRNTALSYRRATFVLAGVTDWGTHHADRSQLSTLPNQVRGTTRLVKERLVAAELAVQLKAHLQRTQGADRVPYPLVNCAIMGGPGPCLDGGAHDETLLAQSRRGKHVYAANISEKIFPTTQKNAYLNI